MELQAGRSYRIRLCSGEERDWIFEGTDGNELGWWRDAETGLSFSATSILYAWELVDDPGSDAATP